MASFEPTIDYCVVKIPRWTFEKFPQAEDFLTTSMKSVGETMAIGRTFKESLQKAIRSLEIGRFSLGQTLPDDLKDKNDVLKGKLIKPNSLRLFYIAAAMQNGMSIDEIYQLTKVDPWFLHQVKEIMDAEEELKSSAPSVELLKAAKKMGFADRALASFWKMTELKFGSGGKKKKLSRYINWLIPARRNLKPTPHITIPLMKRKTKQDHPTKGKWRLSAAVPTASVRELNSTIAVFMPLLL